MYLELQQFFTDLFSEIMSVLMDQLLNDLTIGLIKANKSYSQCEVL